MEMKSTPAPGKCPLCGYKFDLASSVTDPAAVPKAGDFTMCIKCGGILRYAEDLVPVQLAFEDTVEINKDPQLVLILRKLTVAHRLLKQDRARRN